MSELLDIQDKLRDTSAAIAQFEQAIAQEPSPSVAAMLSSFVKRRHVLEEQFQETAGQVGTDACSYRFFSDSVRPTVTPLCASLSAFQEMYSIVYDAIKSGPKKRSRKLPIEVLDESSFFFGYTFSGSVGVVLTFDNTKRQLFETSLDTAMQSVFQLAKARTSSEVLKCGKELGVPAVKAAHKWAEFHASSHLGADIEWRKGHHVESRLLMQVSDLLDLANAIANTSEDIEDDIDYFGRLAGADVAKRTFHLELSDGTDIRGKLSPSIPESRTFEVGATHAVTLRKKVRVYYATEEEEIATFQLISATVRTTDTTHEPQSSKADDAQ